MCLSLFYKKISDLNGETIFKDVSLSALRKNTEILIIDDEEFTYLDILRKHEYNLTEKTDLSDLKDAEAYTIILCDVAGVGKFLGSRYGGAYLIKQLKEKYPTKIIIAYSANNYNAEYQKYLDYADGIVPKGSYSSEDWASLLDKLLMDSVDPVINWKKARKELLDAGVATIDIAKYESDYVKAVKNNKFESFKKLYQNKKGNGIERMQSLFSSMSDVLDLIKTTRGM